MIIFSIPGEPVAKARARATMIAGKARMYTPGKTASYEWKAAYLAKQAMGLLEPVTGPVALTIHAVFAHPAGWSKKRTAANLAKPEPVVKKPDWDNVGKIVSDALNGVCWKDDSQVARATVTKVYGEVPGVLVTVEALS